MRPEYPGGLVLGRGIWRSPVRFPAPRKSFRGHFFINLGISWDVSRSGLGMFSDGFGMVSQKMSKMAGSTFQAELGCSNIYIYIYI